MGTCLNLVDADSLSILNVAFAGMKELMEGNGAEMPVNRENNHMLDRAVIEYVHKSNKENNQPGYDTVRCAFPEGSEVFA